jgi:hypothetical protein
VNATSPAAFIAGKPNEVKTLPALPGATSPTRATAECTPVRTANSPDVTDPPVTFARKTQSPDGPMPKIEKNE